MLLPHIAGTTHVLDTLSGHTHGQIGAGQFGLGSRDGEIHSLLLLPYAFVEKKAGHFDFHLEVGHLKGGILVGADGTAKLVAAHHVVPCNVERGLGQAEALCGHAQTAGVQSGKRIAETFTLSTD